MATWQEDARRAALAHGLEPDFFIRQMGQEAHGDDLRSPAGAQGPAQFMPGTARSVGLTDVTVHQRVPSYNAAAKLMAGYVKQFGSVRNALVAYNAGPGRVGGSLPAETQNYIKTILGGSNPTGLASPTASAGTTSGAAPSSSGSGPAAAPSLLGGGQASDFTSLLGSLLDKPQQQAPAPGLIAPPSFAAHPVLPQGFTPAQTSAPAPRQQDGVSGALSLIQSLGASTPSVGSGEASGPSGGIAEAVLNGPKGIAETVMTQRAGGVVISPHAKPGDPVVSSKQTVGGLHETMGLAGYPAHDFMAPAGSHAVAPVGGTVIKLSGHDPRNGPTNGPHGPLGWSVYIRGDDGKTYFLTHMGSRSVKAGQKVQQGQVIGTVANYDKYGTPSHIHMGVSGG